MSKMWLSLICLGSLTALAPVALSSDPASSALILDMPDEEFRAGLGRQVASQLSAADSSSISSYRFTGDTVKVLAVLVAWDDRPGTFSREQFDSMLFSRNVYPGGSLADYYDEVSYGNAVIVGDVVDWQNAGVYADFNWPDFEAILPNIDPIVDFSRYDGNNDGSVDAVIFIRSGNGEEDSQNPVDIWSFALNYGIGGGPGPFDGVRVPRWNTSPETRPLHDPNDPPGFLGVDTLNVIRVFCHELGHSVGLPDLYDYDAKLVHSTYTTANDANDHPVVDWDIMGYYGYGHLAAGSEIPSHFCGWSKREMGWIVPIDLNTGTHQIELLDIETHADSSLYKIPIDPLQGEYFLLEYRNPRASGLFDKLDSDFSIFLPSQLEFGGDTLDGGLLITHIDDSLDVSWPINNGNPHYSVVVEDAGYNPSRDAFSNPEGHVSDSAQWWYPYETRRAATFSSEVAGQELFGPTTTPSSDGYQWVTGISVTVDSIMGDRLFATVDVPSQADPDGDKVPEYLDNCPELFNPDQMDSDGNDVGDACQACCQAFTGNIDCDPADIADIADLTFLIDNLFINFPALCCPEEANIDGDPARIVDIADLTFLIDYLFINFTPTAACF